MPQTPLFPMPPPASTERRHLTALTSQLNVFTPRCPPRTYPSSHTQHNYTTQTVTLTVTLTSTFYSTLYRYSHPTRNVVCPSGAWFENRPHSTPPIRLAWNPKHVIVQWVGIGTHTIESPPKCRVHAVIQFLYSDQAMRNVVFIHYSAWPHTAAATKRLLKRFRWEVFDHPPPSAQTWLPVIFISFLVWNGHRTTFWHNELQTNIENCCCCCWVLRHFWTSYIISIAADIEREKANKFCSEALILAWGSFMCRKSTTREPQLYFPSKQIHTQDFYSLKKIYRPRPGSNLQTSDPEQSMITTRPPGSTKMNSMWNVWSTQASKKYTNLRMKIIGYETAISDICPWQQRTKWIALWVAIIWIIW